MNKDPHRMDSSELDAPIVEDAVVRAAVNAYAEAAADQESVQVAELGDAQDESPAPEPRPATPEELAASLATARTEADVESQPAPAARAEMENLKRRHANELEKTHKYALDSFVRELLQVRDSLELGLGHSAALEKSADIEKLREGTELTLKLLGDVMEKFGVAAVEPLDQPFDPAFHQAISMQARADVPPNTVVAVVQKGYLLNGRLMRPALVLVSQSGA